MRKLLLIATLCTLSIELMAQSFTYQSGDLLFQDLHCGSLCEAIEAVTPARMGHHYSHIGMVERVGDSIVVIEAIGSDVHRTSLIQFLSRSMDSAHRPRVIVGRLRSRYQGLIEEAIAYCHRQLGKGYDEVFSMQDDRYYCSELIYDGFQAANRGQPFFALHPMTFCLPGTHEFYPAWVAYYHTLGQPIPEGVFGCNPGGIANDKKIKIVKVYY